MTQEETVYIQTLSLFGTDFEPDWVQDMLDRAHRKADPDWVCERKRKRASAGHVLTDGPQLT